MAEGARQLRVAPGRIDLLDLVAERNEQGRRVVERREAGGVDGVLGRRGRREADPQPARWLVDLLGERAVGEGQRVAIAGLRARHDVHAQRHVAHGARKRPRRAQTLVRRERSRRDATARRLEPHEAAAGGGDAHGAAAVRPAPPERAAATAAAAPPLDPPGVRSRSHGLRQAPLSSDSVTGIVPNSGVFVLPITIAPAAFSFWTTTTSYSGTLSAKARHENVVRIPAVAVRSLIGIGTPPSGRDAARA